RVAVAAAADGLPPHALAAADLDDQLGAAEQEIPHPAGGAGAVAVHDARGALARELDGAFAAVAEEAEHLPRLLEQRLRREELEDEAVDRVEVTARGLPPDLARDLG